MDLYYVVEVFGLVAATVGPLPHHDKIQGTEFCEEYAEQQRGRVDKNATFSVQVRNLGTLSGTHKDITFECVWADTRPIHDPALGEVEDIKR